MSQGKSRKVKPQLARSIATLLLAFGVAYYLTLIYPDLPPARLLLGSGVVASLALLNGLIYSSVALLLVSVLYNRRS